MLDGSLRKVLAENATSRDISAALCEFDKIAETVIQKGDKHVDELGKTWYWMAGAEKEKKGLMVVVFEEKKQTLFPSPPKSWVGN